MGENIGLLMLDFILGVKSLKTENPFNTDLRKLFIETILRQFDKFFDFTFRPLFSTSQPEVSTEIFISSTDDSTLTLKLFSKHVDVDTVQFWLTLTFEFMSTSPKLKDNLLVQAFNEVLKHDFENILQGSSHRLPVNNNIPPPIINRALEVSPYFSTSDDRIIEYGLEEIIVDCQSKYQHIQIFKTVDHGKVLFLDGAVNLAEGDTQAYTHQLMDLRNERDNFADSRVLILGGGDGGLLKELLDLKNPPSDIIMVELDEVVLNLASKHLRSICGPYLDKENRHGKNYKVIVGDAVKYMESLLENGETFDFVFGDLTDVPVDSRNLDSVNDQEHVWSFLTNILRMGVQLLKIDTGKYLTHCNGKSANKALRRYEEILNDLSIVTSDAILKCVFEKSESFVPSFMEVWTFYKLRMVQS